MPKTVTIDRQSNGSVIVTVNGSIPRGINDEVNLQVKPIDNFTGCVIKSISDDFQLRLYLIDTITINGTPAPTNLTDLINILNNWVFGGTTTYATPTKLANVITVTPPASVAHTAPPFALQGVDSAGLPIVWTSSDASKFTISGNILTPVAAGTANILANQAGNNFYSSASQVTTPYTLT